MDLHQRALPQDHQTFPTDVTEERKMDTGPNSAFIANLRDTIRTTPGTYESILQLLVSLEPEIREAAASTNNSSPRSECSSTTVSAPKSPMQELPLPTRLMPGPVLGSYTNMYVPGPVYNNCDWSDSVYSLTPQRNVSVYDDHMDVDVIKNDEGYRGGEGSDVASEASTIHPAEGQEQYEPMDIDIGVEVEQQHQQAEDQQQHPEMLKQHSEAQQQQQPEEQPFHPQPSPSVAQPNEQTAQPNEQTTQPSEQATPATQPSTQTLPAPDFLADPFAGGESRTRRFIRTIGQAAMVIQEMRYGREYVQSGALFPSRNCEGYEEFQRRLAAAMRMSPSESRKKCFVEVEICLEVIVDCLVVAQVLEMVQNWSAWGVNPLD